MTGACPRCGYDLSGAIAAWQDACPLSGVCSECGLDLEWADVLSPARTVPAWSFEHARGRYISRLLRSSFRALAPWRLWKPLRMEHPVSLPRLLLLAGAWLALAHAALGLEHALASYHAALESGSAMSAAQAAADAAPSLAQPYRSRTFGAGWNVEVAYPAMRPPAILVLFAFLALMPLTLLLLPDSLRQAKVRRLHIVRGGAYACAVVPLMAVLWAFAMLLGRVDIHIWVWHSWRYLPLAAGLIVAIALMWQWLHWWMFARRYLRLPHGAGVATAMIALPALLLMTAIAVLDGAAAVQLIDGWWSQVARAVDDALRQL